MTIRDVLDRIAECEKRDEQPIHMAINIRAWADIRKEMSPFQTMQYGNMAPAHPRDGGTLWGIPVSIVAPDCDELTVYVKKKFGGVEWLDQKIY